MLSRLAAGLGSGFGSGLGSASIGNCPERYVWGGIEKI
jgi:hypothetical protein